MTKMIVSPIGESDYNELLRQAVAVIDQARASIALHANSTISAAHWNLGQLLHERKLESKHGSGVVNRLLRIEENRQVGRYSRTSTIKRSRDCARRGRPQTLAGLCPSGSPQGRG